MAAAVLKNKGFGLIEVLVSAALMAAASACLVPVYGCLQGYLLNMQAERAARQMAGDIAALQQQCFYDISGKSRLEMDSDKSGYRVYYGGGLVCRRKFSAASGLYFNQHFNALKFSTEGAPTASNNYIIKCRYDKTISKWLQVQPVTGRVVFK